MLTAALLPHSLLALAVTLGALRDATFPFKRLLPLWDIGFCFLGAIYLILAFVRLDLKTPGWKWLRRLGLAVFPVCTALMLVANLSDVLFRVSFSASRAALESEAARLLAQSPTSQEIVDSGRGPGWSRQFSIRQLGSYKIGVTEVDQEHGHVYFSIGPGIRMSGLVFTGDSHDPPNDAEQVSYLPRNWWLFAQP